jgi:hypothetical protein
MSQLANQWIDIFRAHSGENGDFTEKDIQDIVNNYNPEFHEAPAVVGHPKTNGPAFGWVEKVRKLGDRLQAKFKDNVDPTFEQMVKDGKFTKRSSSLYRTDKGLSLRHVGFLGAQPPVVKGLADISFSQEDKDAIEIEFSEGDTVAELKDTDRQSIIDGIIAGFKGLLPGKPAAADKTFSEAEARTMVTEAVTAATTATEARINKIELQFSEREKHVATSESKQRAEAAILLVKSKGAWVPAYEKLGLPLLFAELATRTETIEFGEGESKKKQTPLEILVNFMETAGKIVPTGNLYTGHGAGKPGAKIANINESVRASADPNSIQFAEKIRERMGAKQLDYDTAMTQIAAEYPELTVSGGHTIGTV